MKVSEMPYEHIPFDEFEKNALEVINGVKNSKNADEVLPADGDTNSFTSGVDINPLEPNGVIITAGQYTNFQDGNGVMPAKGSYIGASTKDRIIEGNGLLIGNETVVTGSGSNQNFSGSSSIPSAKTTADVIVNITIK